MTRRVFNIRMKDCQEKFLGWHGFVEKHDSMGVWLRMKVRLRCNAWLRMGVWLSMASLGSVTSL